MPLHNELWFPSPIWSGKFFNVDNDELKKFAYEQKERDTGVSISNVGGWQSKPIGKGLCSAIDTLVNNLDREFNEISKQVGLPQLQVYNIWININPKGAVNLTHDHMGAIMSGAYYVQAEQGNGNIKFERPDDARYYLPTPIKPEENKPTYFNTQVCEYASLTNAVYLFPAWLPHRVEQNIIDKDRISVSFNYGIY